MNATTMVSNHSVNWAAQPFPKEKGKHLSEILILVTPSICWPRKMLSFLSTSSNIFKWISRFHQGFHHNFNFDPRRTRGPCLSATWRGILLLIWEYRSANHAASQPPFPPAPQNPGPSSGREEILFHIFSINIHGISERFTLPKIRSSINIHTFGDWGNSSGLFHATQVLC